MKCQYCEHHTYVAYYDDKRICENCYEAFRKVGLSKMKKDYLKVAEENNRYKNLVTLNEEKLLKELKEKDEKIEGLKKNIERFNSSHALSVAITTIDDYEKIVKEKDDEIKELERKLHVSEKDVARHYHNSNYFENELKEAVKISNWNVEEAERKLKEKDKEIKRLNEKIVELELGFKETQYEEWCELKYWYVNIATGQTNMYRQHMNYEDACELIGMDSDNWTEFNVVKYKKEVK
ncbi:hypothetical protein KNV66_gp44 [Bacillus phage DLc1]|uniref:Uncharacterized protein n=1 Tax=Bacillus phage DLc1 TaxID=2777318 RepID=A0A7M1RRD3_9CAUD|nr:hypothetical protein KNV66_gp44 [Bacillus phage DLc1]QOR56259.1 hypothetical protein [Bacillus phage DLc1]